MFYYIVRYEPEGFYCGADELAGQEAGAPATALITGHKVTADNAVLAWCWRGTGGVVWCGDMVLAWGWRGTGGVVAWCW